MQSIPSLLVAAAFAAGTSLTAQAPSAEPTAHIELILSQPPTVDVDFSPPPALHASDFRLQQNGKRIPFHLASSASGYARHLLIVTPAPLACDTLPEGAIRNLLKQGWSVRLTDTTGNATAELTSGSTLHSACASTRPADPSELLQALQSEPGRRVMLFTSAADPHWLAEAPDVPEIYTVDGGVPVLAESFLPATPTADPNLPQQVTFSAYGIPCSPVAFTKNDPCNLRLKTAYNKAGFRGGLNHRKSIPEALKAINLAADRYYDLLFHPIDPVAPVQFDLRRPVPIGLTATMYSVHAADQNTPSRTELPLDLHFSRR